MIDPHPIDPPVEPDRAVATVPRRPAEPPAAARPARPVRDDLLAASRARVVRLQRRDRALRAVAPLVTAAALAAGWELWAESADSLMVPGFFETVGALFAQLASGEFWSSLATSSKSAALGFLAAVVIGVPIGVAMARFRRFERVFDVYVNIVLTTPIAAVMPLLLMITGIGTTTLVIIVFLFAWPFVVVNSRAGVRSVDGRLIEMARSFGASERVIWTRILLPAAAPGIFVALRLGLARAINGVFIAELILIAVGVGGLLLEYRARFDGPELYATVLAVILLSLGLLNLLKLVQRRLFPWSEARIGAPR